MRSTTLVALLAGLSFSSAGLFLLHCSVEDEPLGAKPGVDPTDDAAGADDALRLPDGALVVPGLCSRVGGATEIAALSNAIYEAAAADCRIGAYFAALSAESVTHVKECMARHLAEVSQCPDSTYVGFKSSVGRECRDMATAHAGLVGADNRPGLNAQDALAYTQAAQAAMRAKGVGDGDVTRVIALFNALQPAVATRISSPTDRNTNCTCPGAAFNGEACAPDGGYVKVDAGRDATPDTGPKDSAADTKPPDTGPPDTGPADTGAD